MFTGLFTLLIIVITFVISYKGFNDKSYFNKLLFDIDKIQIGRQYYRLIASGFIHVNWMHLILNIITVYFFGTYLEGILGGPLFLLLYFGSLVGGDLFALWIHRRNGSYQSVGASGAVCGLIFASIALIPGMSILFIPGWLYGLLFVGYTIYGMRAGGTGVGHEAHLGGGITGLFIALLIQPSAISNNYFPVLMITVPSIIFLILLIRNPNLLLLDSFFSRRQNKDFYSVDHKYNAERKANQKELDRILEKIHQKGMNSLSQVEKDFLKEHSQHY